MISCGMTSKLASDRNSSEIVCAFGGNERFRRGKCTIICIVFIKDQIMFSEALRSKLIEKCTATKACEVEEADSEAEAIPSIS